LRQFDEAVVPVEAAGTIVFRIDDNRAGCDVGGGDAHNGIAEKHGTELAALICGSDREAADQDGGDSRIAGEAACHGLGQLVQPKKDRRERVVAGDHAGRRLANDEAAGDPAADILRRLPAKILVERPDPAGER
jgi:hypothetical protein